MIGNGHYPDATAPLAQPINDARALTAELRRDGFDVDVVEDACKDDMTRAVARLKSRIRPDSVVLLYFGGYGVQAGRESYMIPVDAAIWREADVRRQGVSIESVLDVMKERGARTKLVVVDASRRNPYERRFRAFSHGLAPIAAPDNALILSSATPGKVADDSRSQLQRADGGIAEQPLDQGRHRSPPSTRPASRSPAPPTASRFPRFPRRCPKTSISSARPTPAAELARHACALLSVRSRTLTPADLIYIIGIYHSLREADHDVNRQAIHARPQPGRAAAQGVSLRGQ